MATRLPRPVRRASFWVAVGGVALISPLVLNVASDRFGNQVPGLRTLNDYLTRRNG